jgi:hypothetical protein
MWIRALFIVAGVYDGVLGAAFLIVPAQLFRLFDVIPPNHFGYVKFPALLLLVFAAMFFTMAGNAVKYRSLMPFGMGLKIAYCGTIFSYALTTGIPGMWLPWAWADLAFLVLFVVAWRVTGKMTAGGP